MYFKSLKLGRKIGKKNLKSVELLVLKLRLINIYTYYITIYYQYIYLVNRNIISNLFRLLLPFIGILAITS